MIGELHRTFRDPELEERFRADGYVVLPLLTEHDVAHFRRRFDEWYPHARLDFETTALNEHGDLHHLEVHEELRGWFQDRVDQVFDRQDIRHAYTMCKRGGTGEEGRSEVVLHQDWSYLDEREVRGALVWCPLVDTTEENGWLQVVPGSHRITDRPRGTGLIPWPFAEVEAELREQLEPLPMRAGEVVVYDGALIHCSPPNRTDEDRPVLGLGLAPVGWPMLHFHSSDGRVLERFEVTDAFYLTHALGGRPETGYVRVSQQPVDHAPVTPAEVQRLVAPGRT